MSGWEIIRDNFEDDHCRSFMLWMAFQTVVPPEWPMSGRLAYSLVYGRQRWSWCVPKGGSGAFSGALARLVEAHGGVILTDKRVQRAHRRERPLRGCRMRRRQRLSRRQSGAVDGAHQASGRDGAARRPGATISSPGVETWQAGPTLFVTHYATSEPMRFKVDGGTSRADGGRHPVDADAGLAHGLRLRARRREHRGPGPARGLSDLGRSGTRAARQAHRQGHRLSALRSPRRPAALGRDQGAGLAGQSRTICGVSPTISPTTRSSPAWSKARSISSA